ncbi:MAG: VPLPA-CTERM sorting domain-containing protein, partial [Sneathiellales bacterium]|nr:VPLPA-CTERM sorting domain-containing protein [Sneathiellales bacterium]
AFFSDSDGDGRVELRDQTLKQRNYEFPDTAMTYGTLFGIGAMFEGTEFYIDSITVSTVSAVPLPPAALLFGGAVVGLGWITRRRKAATPS